MQIRQPRGNAQALIRPGRRPLSAAALIAGTAVLAAGPAFAGYLPAGAAVASASSASPAAGVPPTARNEPPPPGAILDLGGGETGTPAQSINHGAPIAESVSFTGALTSTDITFAFRDDPTFISFGAVSLVDTTTGSGNLISNGDFTGGTYVTPGNIQGPGQAPVGWVYTNVYGAITEGRVFSPCAAFASGSCWLDGSVQAYDTISQTVATQVGDAYTLSFLYTESGSAAMMSDLSTNGQTITNGGNGVDILAYAQAGSPVTVPEPATLSLLGAGLAALSALRRRRAS